MVKMLSNPVTDPVVARRGEEVQLYSSKSSALEGGEWSASRPGRSLPQGKDPVPIVQEAGRAPETVWTGSENLASTGIRSSDIPTYQLLIIIKHNVGFCNSLYYDREPIRYDIHVGKSCRTVNPLNPELNPICYLLALLVHHFLQVSRIRVKSLTLRLLMSYIYIYIYIYMGRLFLMSLDHTQRRSTVGRTPLDE